MITLLIEKRDYLLHYFMELYTHEYFKISIYTLKRLKTAERTSIEGSLRMTSEEV